MRAEMGPLGLRLVNKYVGLLKTAPLRTQALSTAALWSLGDVLSQKLEGKRPLDTRRTLATAIYGGTFIGPFGHWWYRTLDKVAARHFRPGRAPFIAAKVAADTAVFGPLHIVAFFSYMVWWEGGSVKDVRNKLKSDFWPTMGVEFTVWPCIQVINFWRVPLDYHLLVVNAVAVLESTFMCTIVQQDDWWPALKSKAVAAMQGTAAGGSGGGSSSGGAGDGGNGKQIGPPAGQEAAAAAAATAATTVAAEGGGIGDGGGAKA